MCVCVNAFTCFVIMKIQLSHNFNDIVKIENLLEAWSEFIKGKRNKKDVQEFSLNLMDNIFQLNADLIQHTYKHGSYQAFNINDPKPRNVHKASVRDRLLHHAIYRILYPFFDKIFITDSFSCRNDKGTHRALTRFREFGRQVSRNNARTGWILKCDIKKFFASIDHKILMAILAERIMDKDILRLLENIVSSFKTVPERIVGLPLGNLTSQLFVNIYMDKFDQFVKHTLKAKYYIRYADDFVFFSADKLWLENVLRIIDNFLQTNLHLTLHPDKIFLRTVASGVDFLGWVNFYNYRVLRKTTKRRMFARIKNSPTNATLQSYLGLLKHGDSFGYKRELEMWHWLFGGG